VGIVRKLFKKNKTTNVIFSQNPMSVKMTIMIPPFEKKTDCDMSK
jgi:hypothetical protein